MEYKLLKVMKRGLVAWDLLALPEIHVVPQSTRAVTFRTAHMGSLHEKQIVHLEMEQGSNGEYPIAPVVGLGGLLLLSFDGAEQLDSFLIPIHEP